MIKMKNNKNYRTGYLLLAFSFLLCSVLFGCKTQKSVETGGQPVVEPRSNSLLGNLGINYPSWETCRLNGKLRAPGLPVSPTLQVYMEREKSIVISARAPLVGEVMRIELDKDSLLAINRLKKTYCMESAENLHEIYPTVCGELQSLLLGRIIVPGAGELSEKNISRVTVSEPATGERKLTPDVGNLPGGFGAYYLINGSGDLTDLIITRNDNKVFSAEYTRERNGSYDITVSTTKKGKPYKLELEFNKPETGIDMPEPAKPGNRYKRLGIKEFMGNIF